MTSRIAMKVKGIKVEDIKIAFQDALGVKISKPMQGDHIFYENFKGEGVMCCLQNTSGGLTVSCGMKDAVKSREFMKTYAEAIAKKFPSWQWEWEEYR